MIQSAGPADASKPSWQSDTTAVSTADVPYDTDHCILPSLENPSYIYLYNIPSGDYQIDLTAESASNEPPLLQAFKVFPARTVLISVKPDDAASGGVRLFRDLNGTDQSHTITVETNAIDIEPQLWMIEMLYGDTVLAQSGPAQLISETGQTKNHYIWQLQVPFYALGQYNLQAQLSCVPTADSGSPLTGSYALRSEPLSVQVINRSPKIADAAITVYPLVTDLPDSDATQPLTIDLDQLFIDPDQDQLAYSILSPETTEGQFSIHDNLLVYTPTSATADIQISVQASDAQVDAANSSTSADSEDSLSPVLSLTIHQVSASETLQTLRFLPDTDRMYHVAMHEKDFYTATTGEDIVLAYRLASNHVLQDLLDTAAQSLAFVHTGTDLLNLLTLLPQIKTSEESVAPTYTITKSIDGDSCDLLVTLHIDPQYHSGSLGIDWNASCGSLQLLDLLPSFDLVIDNSAPYRLDTAAESMRFTCELQDYPWLHEKQQLSLSEIMHTASADLSKYFTDRETASLLYYTVRISGTAQYNDRSNKEIPENASLDTPQEIVIHTSADGTALLSLSVFSAGELSLAITAHDDEFASVDSISIQVEIQSLFLRLLLLIGLSLLLVGTLLSVIFVIRYIRKPSFQDLQVSAFIQNSSTSQVNVPTQFMPLLSLKKRGISLFTLLLTFMQPPLRTLAAKDANAIILYPSHKGYAVLKLSSKAPVLQVESAVQLNKTTYLLTENRVEIIPIAETADSPIPEKIILFFHREIPSQHGNMEYKSSAADDTAWDKQLS